MVDHLVLNNRRFLYSQIINGDFGQTSLSPFEVNTLEFCRKWLMGEEYFELTTSGSTGTPKPIQISRNQMKASAAMTIEKLELEAGDHILVCMNTAYIAGKMMLVRGLEGNMAMTIVTPVADPFKDLSPHARFAFTALVPLQMETLLKGPLAYQEILNAMKAIIIGGGAVSNKLEEAIQEVEAPVYSTYAMTETVSHIAMRRLNGPDKSDSYQTLPGVTIGQDDRGCLTIHAAVTNFETIVTNDLVTIIDAHSFAWKGRVDNVINSGGIKIHTEQLEHNAEKVLLQFNIHNRFFVAGIPDDSLGEAVVLVMEGESLESNIEHSLLNALKQSLPKYHMPKKIFYLARFILTDTGKIQRKMSLSACINKNTP